MSKFGKIIIFFVLSISILGLGGHVYAKVGDVCTQELWECGARGQCGKDEECKPTTGGHFECRTSSSCWCTSVAPPNGCQAPMRYKQYLNDDPSNFAGSAADFNFCNPGQYCKSDIFHPGGWCETSTLCGGCGGSASCSQNGSCTCGDFNCGNDSSCMYAGGTYGCRLDVKCQTSSKKLCSPDPSSSQGCTNVVNNGWCDENGQCGCSPSEICKSVSGYKNISGENKNGTYYYCVKDSKCTPQLLVNGTACNPAGTNLTCLSGWCSSTTSPSSCQNVPDGETGKCGMCASGLGCELGTILLGYGKCKTRPIGACVKAPAVECFDAGSGLNLPCCDPGLTCKITGTGHDRTGVCTPKDVSGVKLPFYSPCSIGTGQACADGSACTDNPATPMDGDYICLPDFDTSGQDINYEGPILDPKKLIEAIYSIMLPVGIALAGFLIVKSGYSVMTSEGDPQKTMVAKEELTSAIIGAIFVLLSMVLLKIIINSFIGTI